MSSSRSKPHDAPFVGPPWYVAAAWLAGAVIAQTTVVHELAIRNVVPSFVLAVVVWYAVRVNARRAAIFGAIAGLCEDALSAGTGASWMIATGITSLVASVLSRGFFADSIALVAAVAFGATLLRALLFWIAMSLGGYPAGLGMMHLHEALFAALLNAAVIMVAMLVARRTDTART